jgi:hypothetical protein
MDRGETGVENDDFLGQLEQAITGATAFYQRTIWDASTTRGAILTVILVAVCTIANNLFARAQVLTFGNGLLTVPAGPVAALADALVGPLLAGFVFASTTYVVGSRLSRSSTSASGLLRALGFAACPQILFAIAWMPLVGGWVALFAFFWTVRLESVAIREAFNLSGWQTLLTTLLALGLAFFSSSVMAASVSHP